MSKSPATYDKCPQHLDRNLGDVAGWTLNTLGSDPSHPEVRPCTRSQPNQRHLIAFWTALIVVLVLGQFVATFFVPRGFSLTLITDWVDLLLAASAALVFLDNALQAKSRFRLFWMLLAASWIVRLSVHVGWMYFELVARREVPNPFYGDILFFASNIPVLAALLLETQKKQIDWRIPRRTVDFLLMLTWWIYLYLYFVMPWQVIEFNEQNYGLNFDRINALLDAAVILIAGFLWHSTSGRWKWLYGSLFASLATMAVSGYLLNAAIDKHAYYSGSFYDLPYSVGLASFTLVGLLGRTIGDSSPAPRLRGRSLPLAKTGTVLLLLLPVVTAWNVYFEQVPLGIAVYRQFLMIGATFLLACLVFARHAHLTNELAKAGRILHQASITDPLTGARNRRYFDAAIPSDAARILRAYAGPNERRVGDLLLFLIDLDNFKDINDCYGHDVGDKVLLEVTRRLNSVIRKSDVLIRWGGDEFLIVSRYSDRADSANFASRIMMAVSHPDRDVAIDACRIRQTCSIGWAAFPWHQDRPEAVPLEAVLGLADRGVYEAKASGRNRAVGISSCTANTMVMTASSGNQVGTYAVQTDIVLGPLKSPEASAHPEETVPLVAESLQLN